MSGARRRQRRAASPGPKSGRGRPPRPPLSRSTLWGLAILAVGSASALWAFHHRNLSTSPGAHGSTWQEAFQTGERLAAEGKFAEAIPHYRVGITQQGANDWRTHYALALALRNPSVLDTMRLGIRIPEMRSSYDRIDSSREALDELTVALGLARRPEDIAFIGRLVAQIYANWGFVWDPFFIYRQSERYDATGECARFGDAFLDRMRDPTGAH